MAVAAGDLKEAKEGTFRNPGPPASARAGVDGALFKPGMSRDGLEFAGDGVVGGETEAEAEVFDFGIKWGS